MDLVLYSGLEVTLVQLDQHLVYAGLLEGTPNVRINRDIVADVVRTFSAMSPAANCHLFEPDQTQPYPERPHISLLPAVACGGFLRRVGRTEDDWPCWESVVLVWFQDAYAMPIDAKVLGQIYRTDWPALAAKTEM